MHATTVLEGGLDTDSDMYFFPHCLPLLENLEMPPLAVLLAVQTCTGSSLPSNWEAGTLKGKAKLGMGSREKGPTPEGSLSPRGEVTLDPWLSTTKALSIFMPEQTTASRWRQSTAEIRTGGATPCPAHQVSEFPGPPLSGCGRATLHLHKLKEKVKMAVKTSHFHC